MSLDLVYTCLQIATLTPDECTVNFPGMLYAFSKRLKRPLPRNIKTIYILIYVAFGLELVGAVRSNLHVATCRGTCIRDSKFPNNIRGTFHKHNGNLWLPVGDDHRQRLQLELFSARCTVIRFCIGWAALTSLFLFFRLLLFLPFFNFDDRRNFLAWKNCRIIRSCCSLTAAAASSFCLSGRFWSVHEPIIESM